MLSRFDFKKKTLGHTIWFSGWGGTVFLQQLKLDIFRQTESIYFTIAI